MVFLLVSGAIAVAECLYLGGEVVFLVVSEAPALAKWYSCSYLGRLRWQNGLPACIWWTCGSGMVFLLVSGALAAAKWHS